MPENRTVLQESYDRVAEDYAEQFFHELDNKPKDRELLADLVKRVGSAGRICDLGCGPGQIARYLRDCGGDAFGLDVSAGMVAVARRLNPDIEFVQGSMLDFDLPDDALGGIAAFYSIIHIPREKVVDALREIKRVLRPNGLVLLAFHQGSEIKHVDEWWGHPVNLDFAFFQREEMEGYLQAAGLVIDEVTVRPPYEGFEFASTRVYILARKPAEVRI